MALTMLSCSKAFLSDNMNSEDAPSRIVITGVVTESSSNQTLSDIKITFNAYDYDALDQYDESDEPTEARVTKTLYTDGNGTYTVAAEGFVNPILIIIKAEDQNGVYTAVNRIKIHESWSGSSFVAAENTAYINDCNIEMKKGELKKNVLLLH